MKKLFIIFAVLCLAAPAMAADWNFYGSARMATFWIDQDGDTGNEDDDDQDLQWAQQTNSRFGANVKASDEIGGGFEYGTSGGNANIRKLFGTYTFGAGQLLIGQTYTPTALFYSNSVFDGDGDLLGVGEFYEGRLPMIQLKMGGFKVALISPSTTGDGGTGIVDKDTTIPKIEASYRFKTDMFFVDVFGGYNTFELDAPAGGNDQDVDSYIFGGGGGLTMGAFYLSLGAHMGQNLGNYGAYNPIGLDDQKSIAGTVENDADGFGYLAVVGFNASEMFTIEAGYGHEEVEVDNSNNTEQANQWYLNTTINIAPGFFIVPEVGQISAEDDVNPEKPKVTYFGAKWQINF